MLVLHKNKTIEILIINFRNKREQSKAPIPKIISGGAGKMDLVNLPVLCH